MLTGTGSRARGTQHSTVQIAFFSSAHAVYDSLPQPIDKETLNSHLDALNVLCGVDAAFKIKVGGWLLGKSHCRHHMMRSDATQQVLNLAAGLPCDDSRLLFFLLVVSACNHRDLYTRWADIARRASRRGFVLAEMQTEVNEALCSFNRWLAGPRTFPVSRTRASSLAQREFWDHAF